MGMGVWGCRSVGVNSSPLTAFSLGKLGTGDRLKVPSQVEGERLGEGDNNIRTRAVTQRAAGRAIKP